MNIHEYYEYEYGPYSYSHLFAKNYSYSYLFVNIHIIRIHFGALAEREIGLISVM